MWIGYAWSGTLGQEIQIKMNIAGIYWQWQCLFDFLYPVHTFPNNLPNENENENENKNKNKTKQNKTNKKTTFWVLLKTNSIFEMQSKFEPKMGGLVTSH